MHAYAFTYICMHIYACMYMHAYDCMHACRLRAANAEDLGNADSIGRLDRQGFDDCVVDVAVSANSIDSDDSTGGSIGDTNSDGDNSNSGDSIGGSIVIHDRLPTSDSAVYLPWSPLPSLRQRTEQ